MFISTIVRIVCEMDNIALTEKNNIQLVREVEKYPCLFKRDTVEYRRRHITDKAWAEVGRVVGWPGTYLFLSISSASSVRN